MLLTISACLHEVMLSIVYIIHVNLKQNNFDTQGHEGRYSIYVHASRQKPVHTSSLFVGRDIHSDAVIILICPSVLRKFAWVFYINDVISLRRFVKYNFSYILKAYVSKKILPLNE